jgi:uncharacterized protein involved in exopolysaccharide biosynthesis
MPRSSDPSRSADWLAPPGPREGLGHYAEVIRDRRRLIVACVVIVTLVAGVYAKLAPTTWKAESHLLITPVNGESNLIGLGLIQSSGNPTGDVSTAASLVTTSDVAALAAINVGHTTGRAILGEVSAVPVAQSNVVAITATASTAARAQAVANAFSKRSSRGSRIRSPRSRRLSAPARGRSAKSSPSCRRCWRGPTRPSRSSRLPSSRARRAGRARS